MSLFDAATSLALRYLPRDQFAALREQYFAMRTKMRPVLRTVYGGFDSAALKEHLDQRVGARLRDSDGAQLHQSHEADVR